MKHGCRRIARALLILVVMLGTTVPNAPPVSASSSGYASYHFEPSPNYTQNDSKAVLKIVADNSGLPAHQVTWKDPQGNIAACPGCSTTYDYSANGGIISSTSDFFIAGQQRVSGTYTAVVTYCTFSVGPGCISWAVMFSADFSISDGSITYTIAGNAGMADATLRVVDDTDHLVTADETGAYTITVASGWSGTVIPEATGYTFSPANRMYTNVQADQTEQNYSATLQSNWTYLPLMAR